MLLFGSNQWGHWYHPVLPGPYDLQPSHLLSSVVSDFSKPLSLTLHFIYVALWSHVLHLLSVSCKALIQNGVGLHPLRITTVLLNRTYDVTCDLWTIIRFGVISRYWKYKISPQYCYLFTILGNGYRCTDLDQIYIAIVCIGAHC